MGLIVIVCIFQPVINALSDAPSLPVAGRCQYRRCASDHPVRQEIAAACGELQASNHLQALIACHSLPCSRMLKFSREVLSAARQDFQLPAWPVDRLPCARCAHHWRILNCVSSKPAHKLADF